MAEQQSVAKGLLEQVVKHLAEVDEDKYKFLEEYVFRSHHEQDRLRNFLDNYVAQIEHFLQNTGQSGPGVNSLPFVIIGSTVEVQDINSNQVLKLRVINPLRVDAGFDDVSCLSPVGKALLLKKAGDIISIETPGGITTYKLLSIELNYP